MYYKKINVISFQLLSLSSKSDDREDSEVFLKASSQRMAHKKIFMLNLCPEIWGTQKIIRQ